MCDPENTKCCATNPSGWTCIKLVRGPFDRLVSSYLRNNSKGFPEIPPGGSFLNFTAALIGRAALRRDTQFAKSQARKTDHFLPQKRDCDDDPAVLLIPLECERDAFQVLPPPHNGGALARFNSSKFSSGHYRVKAKEPSQGVSDVRALPFSALQTNGTFPAYSEFYRNSDVRALVVSLYAEDLALYARACRQQWLVGVGTCAKQCRRVLTCHNECN